MGIRSLNSLFNLNPDFSRPHKLHDTRVVFDGYNLANFIYFEYKVPCTYGGDYDRYAAVVKEYFSCYLQCNITPIVILDGGHDKTDRKLQRIIERTNSRLESVRRIADGESHTADLLPIFAYNVFIDVIKELNIAHAQSSFEADGPITSTANHYQCPVISLDSDFYIFDIRSGFIRSDYVDTTIQVGRTGSEKYRYLNCMIYTIDHFLSFFPPVRKEILPLFGTLLGNDFVDVLTFENFFQSYKFPRVSSRVFKLNNVRHKRIFGLLVWLKKYNNVTEAIEDVLKYVPEQQRGPVKELVEQSVGAYKISEPYLVKYIDPVSGFCCASPSETLLTSDGTCLSAWFVDNFHRANISSYVMNIVGLKRMIVPTQIEDTALTSSHNCSLTIREVLYGLLTSLGSTQRDHDRGTCVEEYDRLGNQLQKKSVKPVMVLDGYGTLSGGQLNAREGQLLVCCALGEQNTCLNGESDILQLLVINIRYWLRTCSPKPTESFLDALLLTILYLSFAEIETSVPTSITTENYKTFSPGYYETASVSDVMNDALPVNVDYFRKNFRQLQPSYYHENSIDMSIIHSYSQLQSCLFFSLLINEVIGQPFVTPKMQYIFSGSLIYSVASELERQRSPESFIAQTLGPRSVLDYLFRKLKNVILENLPNDCLRESGLFGAYQRRTGNRRSPPF